MRPQSAAPSRKPQKLNISRTDRLRNSQTNTIEYKRPGTADVRKAYLGKPNIDGNIGRQIWEAFGQYVAKSLKNGKGVWVPKFGNFTFTPMNVDLAGSTNPQQRDKQERFPVFVVGQDFTPQVPMKAGICSGMTSEIYNNDPERQPQIRIFTQKGVSGIIPKVKINYCEIAAMTGGSVSKDQCKELVDQMVHSFADKVRRSIVVETEIPHVGKLIIKNNVTGVIFDPSIIEFSRGSTAKQYEVLFAGNNWMNNKIYQPNVGDFGSYAQDLNQASPYTPRQNLRVSYDAKKWMKNNLDLDYENLDNKEFMSNARRSVQNLDRKLIEMQKRPQSANRSYARSAMTASNFSSRESTVISRVPELAPFQLMNFANQINSFKPNVLRSSKVQMREKLTSSKIQRILQDCGYRISVANLKAVLKELGFNWNGPSCTITALFIKLKEYLNPEQQKLIGGDNIGNQQQVAILGHKRKDGPKTIIQIIKDLFYSTGRTLYEIFRASGTRALSLDSFKALINPICDYTLTSDELESAFTFICRYKKEMTFQDFEQGFRYNIPIRGSLQSETMVIQRVRDWMFSRQYPTEGAYQRLIRSCDRLAEKTMSRVEFHKAVVINKIGLTAPEIDFLFDLLTAGKNSLTLENWTTRIFDDALNPLQLIRELIIAEDMDANDVLFQMKIKAWDEPLTYAQFITAIRRLDPSFGESQIKNLFNKLKSTNDKIDIQTLINNLTGTDCDTVDFKNSIFKQLYKEVYSSGKSDFLLKKLEQHDTANDGKINADLLQQVLKEVTSKFSEDQIQKFVRQLEKDSDYKVSYIEFMDRICALGNKNHSPLKSLLQRLAFFIESNKVTIASLMTKLTGGETSISITKFSEFLIAKVDKRKSFQDIIILANQIDIDKDGMISEQDLKTCLTNLNSKGFFEKVSQEITTDKVLSVLETIRTKMKYKKISCKNLFEKCDTEKVGMINLAQFMVGVNSIVPIATPLLEKLFLKMDINKIGMVDEQKLIGLLAAKVKTQIPRPLDVEDNFDWQENIISQIKQWVKTSKMNSEEAFKSFDQDFDGLISKSDMKKSLIQFLKVKPEQLNDPRLDRLFKLLSFYKTDTIQPTDFERLVNDVNPYVTAATSETKTKLFKSMGGSWANTSTNDWKFAAIQQIGLTISQRYSSIEDSFLDASRKTSKVNFTNFVDFIEKNEALRGFNFTTPLMQKLFGYMDPHQKTFLSVKDWLSAFQSFNQNDHIMVELKNFLQCQFVDCISAFEFFRGYSKTNSINLEVFSQAAQSMLASRRLTRNQLQELFMRVSQHKASFDQDDFFREFQNIQYFGKTASFSLKKTLSERPSSKTNSSSNWIGSLRATQATRKVRPQTAVNSENSKWETDVFKNLQRLVKASGKSLDMIFGQIDTDGSGLISSKEFYKAMKLISLGLTDQEIDKIMKRIDADNDGNISYLEFVAKFRDDPIFEHRMLERANKRLVELNELMIHHMTSPDDAYRMFDSSRSGRMTLLDFDKLVKALMKLGKKQSPCYSVIKDLFDAIDRSKDQFIDPQEWKLSFGGLVMLPINNDSRANNQWLSGPQAKKLSELIAENKNELRSQFKAYSTHSDHQGESRFVTFAQAKKAMESLLEKYFKSKGITINDDHLALMLKVGLVSRGGMPIYDFNKVVDVYVKHQQDAQFLG